MNPTGLTLGIFLLIGVGALARKVGLVRREAREPLNNIIIFIALPSLIFVAARQSEIEPSLLLIAAVSLMIGLTTLAVGYGLAKLLRLSGPLMGAFLLTSGVGNTGYLGYPLTAGIFGREHLVKAVFFDMFSTVLILFTAGIYFAAKYGTKRNSSFKQAVLYGAPNLCGLVFGFATRGLSLPIPLDLAINSLAQSTTGIIMLSIGISLRGGFSKKKVPVAALTALKLGIMPALALILALALGMDKVTGGITLLQASMPVALMTFVIGDKYDLDLDFLSGVILISTLLSMATIPAWQSIASVLHM